MTPTSEKRLCQMCGRNLTGHPACRGCTILLEPELNDDTLCRCGKYHNAPSVKDPRFCRKCKGEEVPTGKPMGETPSVVEDGVEEEINGPAA